MDLEQTLMDTPSGGPFRDSIDCLYDIVEEEKEKEEEPDIFLSLIFPRLARPRTFS